MEVVKTIVLILDALVCVTLIGVVLFQSGKSSGLSTTITGNSDSYIAKNSKAKLDRKLAGMTKWIAAAFLVLTLALCML